MLFDVGKKTTENYRKWFENQGNEFPHFAN